MCEFLSWIEKDDKVYFLTAKQISETTRGKQLQKETDSADDYTGHGAIRFYYRIPQYAGSNAECTDFSKPSNFPAKIAEAIKAGKFRGLATPEKLLTQPALAEYQKIEQPALAEYQKIKQPAWAEYQKIEQTAWAEYQKIKQTAWAEYQKIEQTAWAEYQKIEQPAFWDLFAIPENRNPAWR